MTEVPDYLLERSRARRAAITGGDGDSGEGDSGGGEGGGSTAPAKAAQTAPAPSMPAHPAPVEEPAPPPPSPMVEAYQRRRKIPVWAMPVLAALPIWAYVYVGTLSPPPQGEGPAALGEELYGSQCAGCHGAGGGGGTGPAFTGGDIFETWPAFDEHFQWVRLGSDGWIDERGDTYGANEQPVNPNGMPAFVEEELTDAELIYVILHERHLGGENPDTEDAEQLELVAQHLFEHPEDSLEEAREAVGADGGESATGE